MGNIQKKKNLSMLGYTFVIIVSILLFLNIAFAEIGGNCTIRESRAAWIGGLTATCNGYERIPSDIQDFLLLSLLEEIKSLDMTYHVNSNSLEIITSGQLLEANLPNLSYLFLRSCKVQKIERRAFEGGGNIVEVDLSYNLITVLDPEVFADLTQLQRLMLHHNPIKTLYEKPSVFPSLFKLTKLYLHTCEISSISSNYFKNLENLDRLELYRNKLSTLHWKTFKDMNKLKLASLGGNPWKCDCHFNFLFQFLQEKRVNFTYYGGIPTCTPSPNGQYNIDKEKLIWNVAQTKILPCIPKVSNLTIDRKVYADKINKTTLECEYEGYPKPEVIWLKDGTILGNIVQNEDNLDLPEKANNFDAKFNTIFNEKLTISEVSEEEEGTYECMISTDNSSKTVYLKHENKTVTTAQSETVEEEDNIENWNVILLVWIVSGAFLLLTSILVWKLCCCKVKVSKSKTKKEGIATKSKIIKPPPITILEDNDGKDAYFIMVNGNEQNRSILDLPVTRDSIS